MGTPEKIIVLSDSDSDDEIFFGPVTKREILSRLKHFKLQNNKELLVPLEKMEDNDAVNDSLIKYYEGIFPQRSPDDDNSISESSKHCSPDELLNNLISLKPDPLEDSLNETELTESDSLVTNEDVCAHKSISKNVDDTKEKRSQNVCVEESGHLFIHERNSEISQYIENDLECSIVMHNNSLAIETDVQNDFIEKQKNVCTYNNSAENLDTSGKSQNELVFYPTSEETENHKCNTLNSTSNISDCSLSHTNDQISLNCTLEEMELLMKYGENYMNKSSNDSISLKSNKSEQFDKSYELEKENCSYNSLQSNNSSKTKTPSNFNQNKNNDLSPPRIFKQNGNIQKETKTTKYGKNCNTLSTPEVPSRFRTPIADSPFKMPVKIPSAKKSYKNIRSPIALYIKNSPQVPLVKNVSKQTIHASTFKEADKNYCEKLEDLSVQPQPLFPVKTYKPATKTVLLSKENESVVPNNIRKLIKGPLNPEIIKHVGRVNETPEKFVKITSNYVRDDDMTLLSSSSTVEADVSVHVSKNATRTNRLQNTNL